MNSEYATCPYNPEHKILRYRMPGHLIKCVKNYKGEPLQRCAFNALHLIPPAKMPKHLEEECLEYNRAKDMEIFKKESELIKE